MNSTKLEKQISLLEKQAENLNVRMTHLLTTANLGVLLVKHDLVLDHNAKADALLGIDSNPAKKLLLSSLLQSLAAGNQQQPELINALHKAMKGEEQSFSVNISRPQKNPVAATLFFHIINAEEELIQVLIRENPGGEPMALSVNLDNTPHRTLEEKLKLSENRFRNFVDLTTDVIMYVTIDPPMDTSLSQEDQLKYMVGHTFCGEINDAFRKLRSDLDFHDLIGKPLYHIYNPDFKDTRPLMFGHRFIESGYRIINMETAYEEEDEWLRYYENSLIGVQHENKLYGFWMTMRNISGQKIAEHKLNYRTRLDQLISNISTRFINLPPESIDKNIETAFGEICNITASDAGFLYLFSGSNETFSLTHFWHSQNVQINRFDYIDLPISEVRWILDELEKNGLLIVPSKKHLLTEESKRWVNNARGVESIIIKSIVYQENLVGMMGLISSVPEFAWKEDDVPMLKVISEIFINAIQRKNAEKELMQSEQNYREIFKATFEAILIFNPETGQITDVNRVYLDLGQLRVSVFDRGVAWLDSGTHDSLLDAANFIATVEHRQSIKIACLEEVAFKAGFIDLDQLRNIIEQTPQSSYREYLQRVLDETR